jgi:hypothetical protein
MTLISGFYFGQAFAYLRIRNNFKRIFRENGIDIEKVIEEELALDKNLYTEMQVEKIDEVLYLYDKDANFICQAKTLEDLAKYAKQYKNITSGTITHDNKVFLLVDGNIKEFKSNEN